MTSKLEENQRKKGVNISGPAILNISEKSEEKETSNIDTNENKILLQRGFNEVNIIRFAVIINYD